MSDEKNKAEAPAVYRIETLYEGRWLLQGVPYLAHAGYPTRAEAEAMVERLRACAPQLGDEAEYRVVEGTVDGGAVGTPEAAHARGVAEERSCTERERERQIEEFRAVINAAIEEAKRVEWSTPIWDAFARFGHEHVIDFADAKRAIDVAHALEHPTPM